MLPWNRDQEDRRKIGVAKDTHGLRILQNVVPLKRSYRVISPVIQKLVGILSLKYLPFRRVYTIRAMMPAPWRIAPERKRSLPQHRTFGHALEPRIDQDPIVR